MNILITEKMAPLLLSAVNDAILFHENLLKSQTLQDRSDYEEHLMQLHLMLDHLKEEYKTHIEPKGGLPLSRLFPPPTESSGKVFPFPEN
ncbi:hypothetical protein V8J88_02200 [Massilia sp. W12]|uniref:hypothetical protein n=1 Tax=Massilia sp. W12 TaxID=3126507 RepID=UPI0030CB9F6B